MKLDIKLSGFQRFLKEYGWVGLLRLCFYPLTSLFTTPVRLVQSLWACRVLASGDWGNYNHFSAHAGLNNLFYWTRALNLYRFGRSGRSPYLGLGNYSLSRCFIYSLPSLYAYWVASAPTVLFGMFGWWLSHFVWVYNEDASWVLLVMGLMLISTTFYANTFALQTYNAIGWMFFPLGLYGLATEQWLVAGFAWFAASSGSFTVVFLAGILSLVSAFSSGSLGPIIAILPAGLKLLTHFWPFITNRDLKTSLLGIMKAIGLVDRGVKYKRKSSKQLGLKHIYYMFLYGQFLLVSFLATGEIQVLFLTGCVIFLTNSTYARFADDQSIRLLMFSIAAAVVLQNPAPLFILSFWILASPIPRFANFHSISHKPNVVPKLFPFAIKPFLEGLEEFLLPVKRGERVLMAFNNPRGEYERVFDGYRTLLELPLYVATKKEIHFMPDWWGVFELNYEGATDFWGRDVESVQENINYWNANYVVIYQESGTKLDSKWQENGFETMGKFSWADYTENLGGEKPYAGPTPDWWLLSRQ